MTNYELRIRGYGRNSVVSVRIKWFWKFRCIGYGFLPPPAKALGAGDALGAKAQRKDAKKPFQKYPQEQTIPANRKSADYIEEVQAFMNLAL